MANEVAGRTIIITGASSGIGRATALRFGREGANVVIADVNDEGSRETARLVEGEGGKAHVLHVDVSQADDVKRMVSETVRHFGGLDYAFNNAGIEGPQLPIWETPDEDWHRVMGVDLTGVWLCTKYQMAHMVEKKAGAIVNMASVAGLVGFRHITPYTAAKHGVVGITRAAAVEAAPLGVRVNAVCPGVIRTEMIDRVERSDPEMLREIEKAHPMQRVGTPDEVADVVYWLCTGAGFVTGVAVPIDGGYTAV